MIAISQRFALRTPVQCRVLLHTMGDFLVDMIWEEWDEHYFHGMLPDVVCARAQRCPITNVGLKKGVFD